MWFCAVMSRDQRNCTRCTPSNWAPACYNGKGGVDKHTKGRNGHYRVCAVLHRTRGRSKTSWTRFWIFDPPSLLGGVFIGSSIYDIQFWLAFFFTIYSHLHLCSKKYFLPSWINSPRRMDWCLKTRHFHKIPHHTFIEDHMFMNFIKFYHPNIKQ